MNPPPVWNLWARFNVWYQENRTQAQIAGIAALAIGLIVLMFVITIVVVIRTLR
jgi:hypothetical protein